MLDESNELTTWVFALHRALVEDGYDADALMKRAGFDFDTVTSTSEYITKDAVNLIWEEVERSTGDDAYCLRTIPFVSDTYLNSLVITVQACESIDDVLRSLLKYYRLVDATSKITVSVAESVFLRISNRRDDIPAANQDIDLIFGLITKHAPTLMIDEINPISVSFARPEPRNKEAYFKYFPCPVLFEQSKNEIEFPFHSPSQVIPSANPALSKHLEEYLSSRLLSVIGGSIADDVKREIIHLLPEGTPKLRDVAARLNISERTLQRKLQKYDICFTSLLNKARLDLARKYLKEPSQTIQETAYQLGFSESGNFIRFFKQHTGQTPNAFVKTVTS
tara:strand:- start:13440 stop:14447 length:1008 start_codon:yes stop_codon:yes gene_type:complete